SEWHGTDAAAWGPGLSFNVRVADGLAFLARSGELRIVDVSDPADPRDVGSYRPSADQPDASDFNDLKLVRADGKLYVLLAGATSPILDVSDPGNPTVAASLDAYAHSVFVREDGDRTLAYLANYGSSVPIYDVTDPAAPVLLENVQLAPEVEIHDLFADADRLLVNGTTSGFQVVDAVEEGW